MGREEDEGGVGDPLDRLERAFADASRPQPSAGDLDRRLADPAPHQDAGLIRIRRRTPNELDDGGPVTRADVRAVQETLADVTAHLDRLESSIRALEARFGAGDDAGPTVEALREVSARLEALERSRSPWLRRR